MSWSHSELVERFKQGKTKGSASHMYIEGDTLYSYGSHFPLLVRVPFGYLMNADKYSSSTSRHQRHVMGLASLQVPFSVLGAAGVPNGTYKWDDGNWCFTIIDKKDEVWDIIAYTKRDRTCEECEMGLKNSYHNSEGGETTYWSCKMRKQAHKVCKYISISPEKWATLSEDEQSHWSERTERRPSGAVIEWKGKYYLSSMDVESRHPDYFMVELPHAVETVDEAFESLIPAQVKDKKYRRQGEWFFTEDKDIENPKKTYREMEQEFCLPLSNDSSNPHLATRGCRTNDGGIMVSGGIHHRQHGLLQLSKSDNPKIFDAYMNTAVHSWSTGGKVD